MQYAESKTIHVLVSYRSEGVSSECPVAQRAEGRIEKAGTEENSGLEEEEKEKRREGGEKGFSCEERKKRMIFGSALQRVVGLHRTTQPFPIS